MPVRKLDTKGLLAEGPSEMEADEALSIAARAALRRAGGPLAEVINPPPLNQGADFYRQGQYVGPPLRETPVSPEEVFKLSADPNRWSYQEYSNKYDANPPESFFTGLLGGPVDLGPESIERYDPPKGTKSRMANAIKMPEVKKGMLDLAQKGIAQKDWYKTKPLLKRYTDILGEKKGTEKFIKDIKIFSAVSAGAAVPANVKMASYYQYLAEQGLDLDKPKKGSGYGSLTADTQRKAVQEYLQKGELGDVEKAKRVTFTANFLGQEDYVTSDRHNMRTIGMLSKDPEFLKTSLILSKKADIQRFKDLGFTIKRTGTPETSVRKDRKYKIEPQAEFAKGKLSMEKALQIPVLWSDAPQKTEYKAYEEFQRKLAKEMGLTAAEFQASLWFGAESMTGVESPAERMIDTIEKRVRYTAEQLGVEPKIIFEQYIKGEIPLAQMQDMQSQYGGLLA